jgi:hypothetical protein
LESPAARLPPRVPDKNALRVGGPTSFTAAITTPGRLSFIAVECERQAIAP